MIYTGNDKNLFECEGNLPQDIEFRTLENGERSIAFFSVCTCRKNKMNSFTDRHYFVIKGELLKSEILDNLKKGTRVRAKGVLTYVKREGANFPSAEIKCTSVEVVH